MDYKNLITSALIERCVSRDPLAWAEFVARFDRLVCFSIKKAISAYLGEKNPSLKDLEDIKQSVFAEIWAKAMLEEVRNRENVAYWLSLVSRNITINFLKKIKKEILADDMSFFDNIPLELDAETDGQKEPRDKIKEILSLLNTREKLIFKLYFTRRLSLKDVATMLRLPLGTVSSIISRIRKKIRKNFKK